MKDKDGRLPRDLARDRDIKDLLPKPEGGTLSRTHRPSLEMSHDPHTQSSKSNRQRRRLGPWRFGQRLKEDCLLTRSSRGRTRATFCVCRLTVYNATRANLEALFVYVFRVRRLAAPNWLFQIVSQSPDIGSHLGQFRF